jgi:hypothetical protein
MVIWKFALDFAAPDLDMEMPVGSQVLSVSTQGGKPVLWALCDPDAEKRIRRLRIVMTGEEVPADVDRGRFHGTFQLVGPGGNFVGHVFERRHPDAI